MKNLTTIIFAVLLLTSCASTNKYTKVGTWLKATGYHATNDKGYGYGSVGAGNRYGVYFIGNIATRSEVAMRYAWVQCAELARSLRFTHFVIEKEQIDSDHPVTHKRISGVTAKIMVKMFRGNPRKPGAISVVRILLDGKARHLTALKRRGTRRPAGRQ